METLVYHLVMDSATAPDDYATSMAVENFYEYVIPDAAYRDVTLADAPPARLQSETGREYVQDAFDKTRAVVGPAVSTLTETLTELRGDSVTWEAVLDDSDAVKAAYTLGQVRGTATFLYGSAYSLGIRTPTELDQHLDQYGPDGTSEYDEYMTVVPLTASH